VGEPAFSKKGRKKIARVLFLLYVKFCFGASLGSLMVSFAVNPVWHFLLMGLVALAKFGIISFASMACEGTMYDWSGIYFRKAVHTSGKIATLGFVVYMVAMTLGRPPRDAAAAISDI